MIERAARRAADRIIANEGTDARNWLIRSLADPRSKNIRFLEYVRDAYFPAPPEIPPPPPAKPSMAGIQARVSCVSIEMPPDRRQDCLAVALAGRGTVYEIRIRRHAPRPLPRPTKAGVIAYRQAFKRCGPMGLDRRLRKLLGVASAASEIADLRPPPRMKKGETLESAMHQKDLEVTLEAYEQVWNRRHS